MELRYMLDAIVKNFPWEFVIRAKSKILAKISQNSFMNKPCIK